MCQEQGQFDSVLVELLFRCRLDRDDALSVPYWIPLPILSGSSSAGGGGCQCEENGRKHGLVSVPRLYYYSNKFEPFLKK